MTLTTTDLLKAGRMTDPFFAFTRVHLFAHGSYTSIVPGVLESGKGIVADLTREGGMPFSNSVFQSLFLSRTHMSEVFFPFKV